MDALTIAFLDRNSFASHLTLRPPRIPHSWSQYDNTKTDNLVKRLQGIQIAVTNNVVIDKASLQQLPQLKLIALTATGYNNIDIQACKAAGVAITNVRDYASTTLTEHCMGLMLALSRNLLLYHQLVVNKQWNNTQAHQLFPYPIEDLHEKTLVVIGKGNLGQAVAARAADFGMHTVFAEHRGALEVRPGYSEFFAALAQADVISLHCPLNDTTAGMLDTQAFQAMHKRPLLINTARGGLIDEPALIEALTTGMVRGAALDVLSTEPPETSHPLVELSQTHPNVLITPHIAWASEAGQLAAWEQTMENVESFCKNIRLRRLD